MSASPPPAAASGLLWVGDWLVDGPGNRLSRDGEVRPLRHKAMAVLLVLAREAGQTVAREVLVREVWDGNEYVANQAINNTIWSIRQALGDSPEAPRYLETIPKKGYRLIAEVRREAGAAEPPTPEPPGARGRSALLPAAGLLGALAVGLALWLGRAEPKLAYGLPEALTDYPGLEYLGALSPDGQWLAFAWWRGEGDGRLFLRPRADRKAPPRDVSGTRGEVTGLSWSPDSRALVYTAIHGPGRCTLWHYEPASERQRRLGDCLPQWTPGLAWSPDGRQLAYSGRDARGDGGLFLLTFGDGGTRRLTPASTLADAARQPAWSPDGRRLAFAAGNPEDASLDLYETDLSGQVRRLSREGLRGLHGLGFAPNGRDLVYSTTRQGARQLMLWERDTGQSRPLGLEGSAPAPAGDGSLVYALLRQHRGLGVLELSGASGPPRRLARSLFSDYAPSWHGPGGRLAFVSQRSGHEEIWLSDGEGGALRQLTHLRGVADAPIFAPDGRRLAFLGSCGEGGRYGLCLAEADSGAVRPLLADGKTYGAPAWEADGRHLWLASDRDGRWRLWRVALDGGRAEAKSTAFEPGFVQAAADGSALYYTPRFSNQIQRLDLAGGAETTAYAVEPDRRLASWRLSGPDLVVLTRGADERLERIAPGAGKPEPLTRHPLGTFSEFARFSLAGTRVYIDLADTNLADLMLAKPRESE